MFGVGTQEDASEFFTTLLENMAKSIKYSIGQPNDFQKQHNNNSKKNISNTILDDIFSFQFRSRSKFLKLINYFLNLFLIHKKIFS